MFLALLSVLIVCVYIVANIILVALRNYKAHQFFQRKAPKLPLVPNAKLFSGHNYIVVFKDKNWKIIDKLHQQYGTSFAYYFGEQPWISTKDLDLLKLIELDQPTKHVNRANLGVPFKEIKESIFQAEDDQWRRTRRACAPALTNLKVRSDEVTLDIEDVLRQLGEGIELRMSATTTEEGKTRRSMILHTDNMFQRYALAVIFLIVYKRDGEIDFNGEEDHWVKQIEDAARDIHNPFVMISILFPFTRPALEFLIKFHRTGKIASRIMNYIVEATDLNRVAREKFMKHERKKSLNTGLPERPFSDCKQGDGFKRRLVDTIIDALMDKRIEYNEFASSLFFLLLAGFETTADTITCLVWQLARHPEIQEKLRRSILKEGIDSEYLWWCIQETVRYHPAVPLGTGRVLGEDVTVNGVFYPKGAFVMPSTYSIHHDPEIWPEPEEFKPERWRDTSGYHPAAFMGFGLGPRNCIGRKLAVHEIKLVTRLLLSKYRIEKCSETPDEYEFTALGLVYVNLDKHVKVELVALDED